MLLLNKKIIIVVSIFSFIVVGLIVAILLGVPLGKIGDEDVARQKAVSFASKEYNY